MGRYDRKFWEIPDLGLGTSCGIEQGTGPGLNLDFSVLRLSPNWIGYDLWILTLYSSKDYLRNSSNAGICISLCKSILRHSSQKY